MRDVTETDVATVNRSKLPDLSAGETFAINVGSNCDFTSEINGQTWLTDRPYESGKWGYLNGKKRSTTSEIFNTLDGPLYQTMMEDITDYRIDAPVGRYEVELLFTDINQSGNNSPYLLGHDSNSGKTGDIIRMSIEICDKIVDPDFSPSELSGFQHAVRKKYIVENTTGSIHIHLIPLTGKTTLSALTARKL